MRRHDDLGAIYGKSPEVSAAAASYVSRNFEVIADRLADDNTLMPSGFGLADVLLMSCLEWAIAYGVALSPTLQGYYECHNTRPAYQRAMKINYPDLLGVTDERIGGHKGPGSYQHGVRPGGGNDAGGSRR